MRVFGVGWVVTVFTYQGINHASNGIHISSSTFGFAWQCAAPRACPACASRCVGEGAGGDDESVSGAGGFKRLAGVSRMALSVTDFPHSMQ